MIAESKPRTRKVTPERIERLERKHKVLTLELANRALQRRLDRVRNFAGYDATKPSSQRRQPTIERKDEDQILSPSERLKSHNIGRDIERNFAAARGILHQFRVNVVGSQGKMQLNVDGGDEAADWFNGEWAKDCDFRDDLHWSVILQNVVAGCIREGDMLCVFDDQVTADDTGKLLHWEADQLVKLKDDAFLKYPGHKEGMVQDSGIIRDRLGRILGYIVSGKRGLVVADNLEDVTIYNRDVARLPKNPWRLNQGRGVGSIITAATNFLDMYDILVRELQSAKVAAAMAGKVKRKDAVTDFDHPAGGAAYLPENSEKGIATTAEEGANSEDPARINYERFEALTGGYLEYMDKDDDFELLKIDRPNVHLSEFIEAMMGQAGASVGLARAYTILRADSSYTSFRGDMVLSWATFYMLQKWLERSYADWVGVKALRWGERHKKFKPLPKGFERAISWTWPRMPNVDELKEENAIRRALKNGTTDFSKLLGPNWRKILEGYAEQIDFIRARLLPLGILETESGNKVATEDETKEEKGED